MTEYSIRVCEEPWDRFAEPGFRSIDVRFVTQRDAFRLRIFVRPDDVARLGPLVDEPWFWHLAVNDALSSPLLQQLLSNPQVLAPQPSPDPLSVRVNAAQVLERHQAGQGEAYLQPPAPRDVLHRWEA
jgi:hypothetical protein